MHIHLIRRTNIALTMILAALVAMTVSIPGAASVSAAFAFVAEDGDTQDIIHMRDGRELTGKIIREDNRQVVFRYVDPNLRLETTITLERRDILEIERDVPLDGGHFDDDAPDPIDSPDSSPVERARPSGFARGLAEGDVQDESLPAFYVIPMKGQMGTDIRADVYQDIVEDIRREGPEVVVWVMECADVDELMLSMSDASERGLTLLHDYADLVRLLHEELRGIRQVMWVHDSVGISSLMALAWRDMYMTPGARLTGFRGLYEMAASIGDEDTAAKQASAMLGMINSFLVRGDRAIELGIAMSRPDRRLSATWRGREVQWRLDTSGEYIVNDSDERTVSFRAKTAEDFGISAGTAETLDDLALLLGFREYRVIEGGAEAMVKRYVESWRRALAQARKHLEDFGTHMRWASGEDALRWLRAANNDLRRIITLMRRYPAIELRFMMEHGLDLFTLEMTQEQLGEQIRSASQGGRGRGGGGGGGAGGGRGPRGL